ncbi:response regulator [Pedobacter sp. V48]|uniref:response regulator n=1 Tax=Pedobacter sp. V48 TaxID=509635 RepID=UPI0003E48743|nr:response regulator [Pedobacter sp. V48]ETZ24637.1 hypothetical protein N824_14060 [Pedobacter sp. V48]
MKELKVFQPIEGIKVLIVEDDVVNIFLISKIFDQWHIGFDLIPSSKEVEDALRIQQYHLLLIGICVPLMDSLPVIKLLKASCFPDIPILIFSSALTEEEKMDALNAGADNLLDKPFEIDLLYEKIRSSLSQ